MSDLCGLFLTTGWPSSDLVVGYTSHTIKQISQNGCTIITPELEGFRRPNWAQIEADLCVSDIGRLVFGLTTGWPRNDIYYTCTYTYSYRACPYVCSMYVRTYVFKRIISVGLYSNNSTYVHTYTLDHL